MGYLSEGLVLLAILLMVVAMPSSARLSQDVVAEQQDAYLKVIEDSPIFPRDIMYLLGVTSIGYSTLNSLVRSWENEEKQLDSNTKSDRFDHDLVGVNPLENEIPKDLKSSEGVDELNMIDNVREDENADGPFKLNDGVDESIKNDNANETQNPHAPSKLNDRVVESIEGGEKLEQEVKQLSILGHFGRTLVKDLLNRISMGGILMRMLPHFLASVIVNVVVESIVDLRKLGYTWKELVTMVRSGLRGTGNVVQWMSSAKNAPWWITSGLSHFGLVEANGYAVFRGSTVMSYKEFYGSLINSGLRVLKEAISLAWSKLTRGAKDVTDAKKSLIQFLATVMQGVESFVVENFVVNGKALPTKLEQFRGPLSKMVRALGWTVFNLVNNMFGGPSDTSELPYELSAAATVDTASELWESFEDNVLDALMVGGNEHAENAL